MCDGAKNGFEKLYWFYHVRMWMEEWFQTEAETEVELH